MRKLLFSFLFLAVAISSLAVQIGVGQAKAEAMRFFSADSRLKSVSGEKLVLAYTERSADHDNFYVFANAKRGYVIVSADDCAVPILGYSTEGTFDAENIPDGLKFMMREYKNEINYAIERGLKVESAEIRAVEETMLPIAPLCASRWNQGEPYNNLCPDYSSSKKCVTGCVATAMAQIMKYNNWPEQGKGSNSYTTSINDTDRTLSLDFSDIAFDWDNMTYLYGANSTDVEKDAVAMLMYACGVSVNMNYGLSSGAPSVMVPIALANYFGYDKSVKMAMRDYYSYRDWNNLVYSELAAGRIMYVSGFNDKSGHAFVCDGYDKNGYFHINWGWGGISDGYFRFSALNPSSQGLGGSESGYSSGVSIVYSIKPDEGGEEYQEVSYAEDFVPNVTSVSKSNTSAQIGFTFGLARVRNTYSGTSDILMGAYVVNKVTDDSLFVGSDVYWRVECGDWMRTGDDKKMYFSASVLMNLQKGTYRFSPAFYDTSHEIMGDAKVPFNCIDHVDMVVDDSGITFIVPEKGESKLETEDVKFNTAFYVGESYSVEVTVRNTGVEYNGAIYPVIINDDNQIQGSLTTIYFDIPQGESSTHTIVADVPDIATGSYSFALADGDLNLISNKYPIEVKTSPGSYNIVASNFAVENSTNVDPANVHIKADVECTNGFFNDVIYVWIFDASGNGLFYNASPKMVLDKGNSTTVDMSIVHADAEQGTSYLTALYTYNNGWKQLTKALKFTTSIPTGVAAMRADGELKVFVDKSGDELNIESPESVSEVRVYSLAGSMVAAADAGGENSVSVDISALSQGVYIVQTDTASGTVVKKIVKK